MDSVRSEYEDDFESISSTEEVHEEGTGVEAQTYRRRTRRSTTQDAEVRQAPENIPPTEHQRQDTASSAAEASVLGHNDLPGRDTERRESPADGGNSEQVSSMLPPFRSWPPDDHQAEPHTPRTEPASTSSPPHQHPQPPEPSSPSSPSSSPHYSFPTFSQMAREGQMPRPQSAAPLPSSPDWPTHDAAQRPHSASPMKRARQQGFTASLEGSPRLTHRSQQQQLGLPVTATSQEVSQARLEATVRQQIEVPLEDWTASEVSTWLEFLGLGRYKRVFRAHYIDGTTLINLSEKELKRDLEMEALGHRHLLQRSIEEISRAGDANRMVQASLDEVRHLNRELISLQLKHGWSRRGSEAGLPSSPSHRGAPLAGTQPWCPSKHHIVTHLERAPGNVLEETTFQPEISRMSNFLASQSHIDFAERQRADMQHRKQLHKELNHTVRVRERCGTPDAEAQSLQKAVDFLREYLTQQGVHSLGSLTQSPTHDRQPTEAAQSPTSSAHDAHSEHQDFSPRPGDSAAQPHMIDMSSPMYQGGRIRRTGSLRGALSRTAVDQGGMLGMDAALDECVGSHGSELGLSERQIAAVARSRGPAKVHKLAGALRAQQFLQRYQEDMQLRPARLRRKTSEWHRRESDSIAQASKTASLQRTAERAQEDTACVRGHLLACGWPQPDLQGDMSAASPRVSLLVQRARALQKNQSSTSEPASEEDDLDALQHRKLNGVEPLPPYSLDSAPSPLLRGDESPLQQTLQLLSGCTVMELDKLEVAAPNRKCLVLYRLLAAQRCVERMQADVEARDRRHEEALKATLPRPSRVLTEPERLDFVKRMDAELVRRKQHK
ncbi:hypothetical protein WJX73_000213 [Symbiochloris irregularis]|uniref:SAM domain-containing protein n=1 Tax=Symbiochloris irregularis TaxID=706552 RepID=A0AAW1P8F0_9CHLO